MKPTKWDSRFLDLAEHVAQWSRDPSTKVGAVIVRPDKTIVSVGYNGFARGMDDSPELYDNREVKYERMVHGEMNAILTAREALHGYTIYLWPFLPCPRCAVQIIQTGMKECVAPVCPEHLQGRWGESLQRARQYLEEAKVLVRELILPT